MKKNTDKFVLDSFSKNLVVHGRKSEAPKISAKQMKVYRQNGKFNMLKSVVRDEKSK